jgi:hypothetical protein
MHMFALVTGLLLVQAPTQRANASPTRSRSRSPTEISGSDPWPRARGARAAVDPRAGASSAPHHDGTTAPPGPAAAPPMPPIEELPPRPGAPTKEPKIVLGGAKDRKPIAGGGAGFFDPGKLSDASSGGGSIQIRGYLGFNFAVTQRTNVAMRNEAGTFDQLKTLHTSAAARPTSTSARRSTATSSTPASPSSSSRSPAPQPGAADVSPAFNPVVLMEAAALEVNPFAWASKARAGSARASSCRVVCSWSRSASRTKSTTPRCAGGPRVRWP